MQVFSSLQQAEAFGSDFLHHPAQVSRRKAHLPDQVRPFSDKLDFRFTTCPEHMDMGGVVVVRADHEAEAVEPADRYQ
jgi:hypothetical protein